MMGIDTKKGFTIVELLIVIVVIGILAAITMVAYGNIQNTAKTNRVNAELSGLKKAMLSYKAMNSELPPTGDAWNFDTNPPSCGTWTNVRNALQASGITGTFNSTDPWGNCWGYDDNDCNTSSAVGAVTYIRSVGPDATSYTPDDIILEVAVKGAC